MGLLPLNHISSVLAFWLYAILDNRLSYILSLISLRRGSEHNCRDDFCRDYLWNFTLYFYEHIP